MKIIFFAIPVFLVLLYIVHSLNEITVNETELVDLFPNASDPDGDILTYKFSPPLDSNGRWQTNYGDAGIYDIKISVSDGENIVSENVNLIVNKREEPPTIVKAEPDVDSLDIKENERVEFKVESDDLNMDKLEYVWLINDVEVSRDNSFVFRPDYDESGLYKLVVKVSDGTNVVSREWSVNVINVDMPPVFVHIDSITIKEGEDAVIILDATDPDRDEVSFYAENMPSGAVLEGNRFSWRTNYDTVVKNSLLDIIKDKYHILDKNFVVNFFAKGNEVTASQRVVINVKDVNRAPVLEDFEEIVVNEGESFIIVPKAVDYEGDKISFRYSGWIDTDTYKTGFNGAGVHKVTVVASDGEYMVSKDVTIRVINVNRNPVFNPINSFEIDENDTSRVILDAYDPDGDPLFFYAENKNNFTITNLSVNGNVLTWTPDFDVADKKTVDVSFIVVVSDGEFDATQKFSFGVFDVNRAPEIISVKPDKNSFAYQGIPVRFEVVAKEPDNDKLTYKWNLGGFERYKGSPKLSRKFTELGRKKVSVVVSDGKKETRFEWNVEVIKRRK